MGRNDVVSKSGGAAVPLSRRGLGIHLTAMSPGSRPTSAPSGMLIHRTVWPQYTNISDRTDGHDIGPVQGEPLVVTVDPKPGC